MKNLKFDILEKCLDSIDDPRSKRGIRYKLSHLLICLIYGILCGYDDAMTIAEFVEINFEYFHETYGLNKAPSHDTFSRVLRVLDIKELASGFSEFLNIAYPTKYAKYGGKRVLHIDGKAIKAATRKCDGENIVFFMNSMYEGGSISLYSERIDDKSNEISAIPKYLDNFNLKDCIVTIDGIGCNSTVINKILNKGGSFLIPVKENQKSLYNAIVKECERIKEEGRIKDLEYAEMTSKDHGRIEKKNGYLLRDTEFIYKDKKIKQVFWNIGSVLVIEKETEEKTNGEWQSKKNVAYAITNLTDISCENLLQIKTSHWSIESSHWLLDVQFNEDHCTAKIGNSANNMSLLRRFALAIKDGVNKEKEVQAQKDGSKYKKMTTKAFFLKNTYNFEKIEEYLFTYIID